jgi:hypothetical protein
MADLPIAYRSTARTWGLLTVADLDRERIHRKPVLGGLINEYSRAAGHPEEPQATARILFSSGTGSA